MTTSRPFAQTDLMALQSAIDDDTFHPGVWTVETFTKGDSLYFEVFEDSYGIVAFARYSLVSENRVRFDTIWAVPEEANRNAKVIVFGINQLVSRFRGTQFTELIFNTENPRLANFMQKVFGFQDIGNGEYVRRIG